MGQAARGAQRKRRCRSVCLRRYAVADGWAEARRGRNSTVACTAARATDGSARQRSNRGDVCSHRFARVSLSRALTDYRSLCLL